MDQPEPAIAYRIYILCMQREKKTSVHLTSGNCVNSIGRVNDTSVIVCRVLLMDKSIPYNYSLILCCCLHNLHPSIYFFF